MITIITETPEEYKKMIRYAYSYVCTQRPFFECGIYPSGSCDKCYKDQHLKCGIRVVRVDNENPN